MTRLLLLTAVGMALTAPTAGADPARIPMLDAFAQHGFLTRLTADLAAATDDTALIAARHLDPDRFAVVTVGPRPGPNGTGTYMQVERPSPDASREAAQ